MGLDETGDTSSLLCLHFLPAALRGHLLGRALGLEQRETAAVGITGWSDAAHLASVLRRGTCWDLDGGMASVSPSLTT
jgi:hypothetical protein